jgi:hypothetical protein
MLDHPLLLQNFGEVHSWQNEHMKALVLDEQLLHLLVLVLLGFAC